MRARLLKEARGLVPAWTAALALALGVLVLRWLPRGHLGLLGPVLGLVFMVALALGPLLLCSSTFGREFDDSTFGLLLSQPASRWRLWWEKTGVLALALATVYGAWLAAGANLLPARVFVGIILAAYGGGLLCSLLVRQTMGAVCLSAVIPAVLFVILSIAIAVRDPSIDGRPALVAGRVWVWVSGAWAAAAYIGSLLLFFTREDAAPSGTLAVFGARLRRGTCPAGRVSPWRALVWKELHLQQWGLYIGLALPLLTLVAIALAPFQAQRGMRVASRLASVGVVGLTALVPALVGLTTVAEERRAGTLAWQRTVPVQHWMQFGVKIGVACGLALLCTPWVPIVSGESFVGVGIAVGVIVLLTVCASSLTSHVAEASALSLAVFLALLVTAVGRVVYLIQSARWTPLLVILLPTASILVALACWNAREVTVSRRQLGITVAGVSVAAIVAAVLAHVTP